MNSRIKINLIFFQQDASSFKSVKLITSLAFFFAMIIQLAIQCFTGNELAIQVRNQGFLILQP